MKTLTFKPEFAEAVRDGRKTQTIRPVRKVPVKEGDALSLRMWSDLPYRSKQVVLREAVCVETVPIRITDRSIVVGTGPHAHEYNTMGGLDAQAQLDGFPDFPAMAAWFQRVHGLPFSGVLISWK